MRESEKTKWRCERKLTNDEDIQYGDSSAAARAIHSALSDLEAAPPGHKITKWVVTLNTDGKVASEVAYEDVTVLFTITHTWVGNVLTVERS